MTLKYDFEEVPGYWQPASFEFEPNWKDEKEALKKQILEYAGETVEGLLGFILHDLDIDKKLHELFTEELHKHFYKEAREQYENEKEDRNDV